MEIVQDPTKKEKVCSLGQNGTTNAYACLPFPHKIRNDKKKEILYNMLEPKRLPLMDWKFGDILDFFFQKEDKFDANSTCRIGLL